LGAPMPGIDNEFSPEQAETLLRARIVVHMRATVRAVPRPLAGAGNDDLDILTPALITFFTISLDPRPKGA
jgi:hypothetical protein